jgi:hypothetical protein
MYWIEFGALEDPVSGSLHPSTLRVLAVIDDLGIVALFCIGFFELNLLVYVEDAHIEGC